MTPADLAAAWRDRAVELRRYGAEPQAVTLEAAAAELDAALREAAGEALTLSEAAQESGYATRTLRQMVAEGKLPNAGRKNAPRIRRGDLPRRPDKAGSNGYNPAEDAARLLARR
jgi:hypothetical protein